ncbi:hypothetical protein RchiOBHm_Chr6g0288331 [Rosa chinensis]|uniref:Secreted protein n=1 Tax=Rosa chinensis TaxID=74649 RepID=A0A2P6PVC8_ROSCH|nr:hypothetical protein RchiOBHm_Chr6g0288331 [Rosa chinensis]
MYCLIVLSSFHRCTAYLLLYCNNACMYICNSPTPLIIQSTHIYSPKLLLPLWKAAKGLSSRSVNYYPPCPDLNV